MAKVKGYYFCNVISKEGDFFFFIASRQTIALLACLL